MVGRDVSRVYQRTPGQPGPVVLEVKELRTAANPAHPVSFQVKAGEIVGLSGLIGAGRTSCLEAMFGVVPAVSGEVRVEGKALKPEHPRDAVLGRLALVPEDRKKQGVVLAESVRRNLSLASLERDCLRGLFVNMEAESAITIQMIRELADQDAWRRSAGSLPLRWQSAESGHRQMAGDEPPGLPPR